MTTFEIAQKYVAEVLWPEPKRGQLFICSLFFCNATLMDEVENMKRGNFITVLP